MQYRKLGKWGLKVSEIGLGSWLTYGGAVDEQASQELILYAFDCGINFFDTANVYAHGAAEEIVGKALHKLKRDSIVIATKVFFPMGEGPNDKGLSRKHIMEQCHASLRRLQTDYIDLYQCHRYDPDVPQEELVRTMDDLIRQGKILYWGVSEWTAGQIEDAVETARRLNAPPPVSNQPLYNMLTRTIEAEVIPLCRRLGLGQVVFSPLAQGVLTGKYKPRQVPPPDSRAADDESNMFMLHRDLLSDETLAHVEQLALISNESGLAMAQLALAWCLRLSEVSSVITGATKPSQISQNVKASGLRLSGEALQQIDAILKPLVC
ncbi:MAG: aldo/keto reductase family protein [Candidatus Melainabacteria bacterium]|nr:aldo/keto reductase family protein [Candidatus Melainabacteria bacterium]